MAIVNNGCRVDVDSSNLPADYEKPVVVTFNDHQYDREIILNVPKATVANADPATTMENILADVAVGINKQITDIITEDYVATEAVVAYSVLESITDNKLPVDTGNFFTDVADQYVCRVHLYVKSN
jgi:hypothetical protein